MSARRTLVAATMLAALAGCGPGPLVRRGTLNRPFVDDVAAALSAFRGLPLRAPVPAEVADRDEMQRRFASEIAASFRPGDLPEVEAVNRHLGLLPPDVDLTGMMTRLYERQVAGFYDPRTKTFTVARDAPSAGGLLATTFSWLTGRDPVGEVLVAHELTHALQDQHFGIPSEPEPAADSHGDRLLAQRALFEGDATLAGFAALFGGVLDHDQLQLVTDALAEVPAQLARELPDVPALLRTPLVFQYDHGARFAARALRDGGWAAIDRAHRDPPQSTEQVLHPERYFDRRDPPTPIVLAATEAFARHGWRVVLEDTFGELGVQMLLEPGAAPLALAAADGWDGDRLRAYRRDDAIAVVWLTTWDGEADAVEFATAVAAARPRGTAERRGCSVLVLDLAEAPAIDAPRLAGEIWRRSRIGGSEPR